MDAGVPPPAPPRQVVGDRGAVEACVGGGLGLGVAAEENGVAAEDGGAARAGDGRGAAQIVGDAQIGGTGARGTGARVALA